MGTVMSTTGVLFSSGMAKQLVEKEIAENSVVVFSKTSCGYSIMAKNSLKEAGVKDFKVIELDKRSDGRAIQNYLGTLTGGSTVPRVFINGKFIGGGSETKSLQHSGKLIKLVKGEA